MTPTPCPICGLPGGFHDSDDDWQPSQHVATLDQIPRRLVRQSNTAIRKAKRDAKKAEASKHRPH